MERPPGLAPGLCLVRIEDDFYLPTSAWVVSAEGLAPSLNRLEGDRLICSSHAERKWSSVPDVRRALRLTRGERRCLRLRSKSGGEQRSRSPAGRARRSGFKPVPFLERFILLGRRVRDCTGDLLHVGQALYLAELRDEKAAARQQPTVAHGNGTTN